MSNRSTTKILEEFADLPNSHEDLSKTSRNIDGPRFADGSGRMSYQPQEKTRSHVANYRSNDEEKGQHETQKSPKGEKLPGPERPQIRERLIHYGIRSLRDSELLAILIGTGDRNRSVVELSRLLINNFGGLEGLCAAHTAALRSQKGIGHAKAARIAAAFEIARRLRSVDRSPVLQISKAKDVFELLRGRTESLNQEIFWVISLSARGEVLAVDEAGKGNHLRCPVDPGHVLSYALRSHAATTIVAHNHPSGDPNPSAADCSLTRRLLAAAKILGISVLDHVILGKNRFYSMADANVISGFG